MILMMSDGLPERLNPQDEYFDYDRTKALFAEAAEGTVRKLFAESKERNAIHASDSPDNAAMEVAFFFSEAEIRRNRG